MITPLLERLILRGEASFTVWNHAYGMFGRIPCQDGKVTVITQIRWTPFLDFINLQYTQTSLQQLFGNTEYQLKIESDKGINYFIFRNNIKFIPTSGSTAIATNTVLTGTSFNNIVLQPGEPVIFDTYLVSSRYIKLTISRNVQKIATYEAGLVKAAANEDKAPIGVSDVQTTQYMNLNAGVDLGIGYVPPSSEFSSSTQLSDSSLRENYFQDIVPALGASQNSQLRTNGTQINSNFLYQTTPLVSFDCVNINKEAADELQNTK